MPKSKVQYTTNENALIVETGIKPTGQVRVHVVDDLQTSWYDENDQLIKVQITGLHRLSRMEQSRVIAAWENDPETAIAEYETDQANKKAIAKKIAADAKAKAEADAAAEAEEAKGEDAGEVEVVTPNVKATHKVIDAFADRYAIADTDEYKAANTKAEKVAVIDTLYVPKEAE